VAIALKRFSLISPIINGQVKSISGYSEEITKFPIEMPHYGLKNYAPKTIGVWYSEYIEIFCNASDKGIKVPLDKPGKGSSKGQMCIDVTFDPIQPHCTTKVHVYLTLYTIYTFYSKITRFNKVSDEWCKITRLSIRRMGRVTVSSSEL